MAEFTQSATVLSVTDLTPNVRQLVLLPVTRKIGFQPGQWVSLKLPVGEHPPLNRAYSMAAPSTPSGELTLIFDRVTDGLGSGYLYTLKPGGETWLSGPHGNFILPKQLDRELVPGPGQRCGQPPSDPLRLPDARPSRRIDLRL